MKRILFLLILSAWSSMIFAQQGEFKVEVSNDTVLAGNYMIIEFDIINTNGDFIAPDFNDFDIVSGPNTSSVFSMINGQTTQKSSYTYYLEPKHEGELYIEPAYLYMEGDTLETGPIKIMVLPNPDGKKIEPKMNDNQFEFSFPEYDDHPFYRKKRSIPEKKSKKKKIKTRKL
ncbi:MAG TPA: hypothetical protein ENI82_01750 [Bacteroidetes bacterium]|nr:hypothetical protein [Bacteroidota bacterium]